MNPPIKTIAPDDPWWDDLATPLTRDFVSHYNDHIIRIYDQYMHHWRDDVAKTRIRDYFSIPCEISGNGEPLIMVLQPSVFSSMHTMCSIDSRILTRGELMREWHVKTYRGDAAHTVYYDLREELVHRNRARGYDDDNTTGWIFDRYKCHDIVYAYVRSFCIMLLIFDFLLLIVNINGSATIDGSTSHHNRARRQLVGRFRDAIDTRIHGVTRPLYKAGVLLSHVRSSRQRRP